MPPAAISAAFNPSHIYPTIPAIKIRKLIMAVFFPPSILTPFIVASANTIHVNIDNDSSKLSANEITIRIVPHITAATPNQSVTTNANTLIENGKNTQPHLATFHNIFTVVPNPPHM